MAVKSLCHVSFGPNSWLVAEYVYLLLRIIINHIHNGHKNILSTSLPRTSSSNGEGRALKRGGYVYVCPCIRCTISLSLNHQCSFGLLWWHPVVLWEILSTILWLHRTSLYHHLRTHLYHSFNRSFVSSGCMEWHHSTITYEPVECVHSLSSVVIGLLSVAIEVDDEVCGNHLSGRILCQYPLQVHFIEASKRTGSRPVFFVLWICDWMYLIFWLKISYFLNPLWIEFYGFSQ